MDQIAARRGQAVHLGIPTFTDAAGRTSTNPPSADEPLTSANEPNSARHHKIISLVRRRQDRRGVAGQARRAVDAVPVAGARRADAPGAGSGPGPLRPGRGPHPGQAADREAARRRPDQDLLGAHRRARGVRPGDDRGVDRRAAQPQGAGRAGPGPGPHPAGRPGTGPARPVHRPPRPAGPAAAGPTRRADRAHRPGHRAARRRDQRPAHPHPDDPAAITAGRTNGDHRRLRPASPGRVQLGRRPAVRRPRRRPGLGPRGPRRDRPGHERVRHRRTAVLLGQGRPPHRAVRAQAPAGPAPAKATPTSNPRSPRSPPAPRRPTPSSANATGG